MKSVVNEAASVFTSFDPSKLTIKEISINGGKESIRIYETCIGRGATSTIHLGIHCSGTHVAMKVYPKDWAVKNAAVVETEKKFFYEMGEFGVGPKMIFSPMKTRSFIYFPLEFFNCGSLLDNMRPGLQFPVEIIQKIGLFLAKSLKALHERGLLHGSVRPSHVLIRLEEGNEASFRLSGYKSISNKAPAQPDSEAFYPDISGAGLLLYDIAVGVSHSKVAANFVEEFRKSGKLPLPQGPNPMDSTLEDLIGRLLTCAGGKVMPASAIPDHPFFKLKVETSAPTIDFFTSPKIEFAKSFNKFKESNKDNELEDLPEYPDLQEYILGDVIGEAPFAKNYECKKKGRNYNVQVVSPEITDEGFNNILKEIDLHRKLKNIPTTLEYIDYFTINNRLYIVTEPSTGKTLDEYVRERVTGSGYKLTADDINTIVINVSLGIKAMHENKMALRDLRPNNFLVVLNEDGSIKALKLKSLGYIFIGADTIDFMAPEIVLKKVQLNVLNFKQMQKIDTWGFGELLHFLCYGAPLYTTPERCQKYIADSDTFPPYNSEYSKELHEIMKQCLKPDPSNRPEILALLKNPYFSTGFPVLPEGLIPFTLGKRISRHTNVPTMICECYNDEGKYLMKMVNYINLSLSEDKAKIDREINIMKEIAEMKIPHVSKMHSHFLVNGIFYLVLEYANGGDLYGHVKDRIEKDNPPTPAEQELIIQHILEAMTLLHAKGIVHGDLHPKNILVCVDPETQSIIKEVKLGDFGFAQLLSDKSDPKRMTELKSFVSPEMFKQADQIDYKVVDVWALGMIVFFVLYGFEASEYFTSEDVRSNKALGFPKETYKISNKLKQAMMMCLDKKLDSKLTMERLEQLLYKKSSVAH